ncbi:MAG: response regulator [archaeon]
MTNPKPILRNERVLVVDDIPKWIKVAKDNLDYYGCPLENIVTAEDVQQGYKIYEKEHPTLIMTDINFDVDNLEDTQGLDLIRRIREGYYPHPIVAMSSLKKDIKERSLASGANYFINKNDFVGDFDYFMKVYLERR